MAAITGFLPPTNQHQEKKNKKKKKKSQTKEISSWEQLKNILSCKSTAPTGQQVHDPSKPTTKPMSSYCGSSLCAIRDVVHGNTRVVHRADTDHCSGCSSSPGSSRRHETVPLAMHLGSGSRGGMQLRSLSGCYESHAVSIESGSRRYPRPRAFCVHVQIVVRCLLSLKVWNSIKLPSMQCRSLGRRTQGGTSSKSSSNRAGTGGETSPPARSSASSRCTTTPAPSPASRTTVPPLSPAGP
ncbi:hypothetical protein IHE45_04G142500 [Dioscorea alata]|uniref:Uncharacterized protein n=1 Tax=Dioscorea alata TaxID=55571 RepID=A0ACB7WG52_DIOAL|nr:hypothetical protein IHE45_04G142500 [Dioscorea alata]